jgi:hypothetical protein
MGTRNNTKDKESLSPEAERLLMELEERLAKGESVEHLLSDIGVIKHWAEIWPQLTMQNYLYALYRSLGDMRIEEIWNELVKKITPRKIEIDSLPQDFVSSLSSLYEFFKEEKNKNFSRLIITKEEGQNREIHLKIIAE